MVSVLEFGSTGPGSGPGRGHCVVLCSWARHFTPISRCLSTGENAGDNPAVD